VNETISQVLFTFKTYVKGGLLVWGGNSERGRAKRGGLGDEYN
jgi:hypothetical protein